MSQSINNLKQAQETAMKLRPQVGGFPVLAEVLRQFGILKNIWTLPSCQSLYLTKLGAVMVQGTPLTTGLVDVPIFNQDALIHALRTDQAGTSTFPEFLNSTWKAGIIRYEVDFENRCVTYFGINDESYSELYPLVTVNNLQ